MCVSLFCAYVYACVYVCLDHLNHNDASPVPPLVSVQLSVHPSVCLFLPPFQAQGLVDKAGGNRK